MRVLVVAALLAVVSSLPQNVDDTLRCKDNEVCVERRQCVNGSIDHRGTAVIQPRMLRECDWFNVCCALNNPEPDSDEVQSAVPTSTVTTTTTEESPPDPNWSRQCGERTNVTKSPLEDITTNRYEFPWNVAVFSVTKIFGRTLKVFLCGGALIDDYIVLTAARCVRNRALSSVVVQVGRWDINAEVEPRTQEVAVEKIHIHKEYVASTKLNNIALLLLDDGVHLGKAANRVCLPEATLRFEPGALCYVVGWSDSPEPDVPNRQLKMLGSSTSTEDCTASIRRTSGNVNFLLPSVNFCTAYENEPAPCERAPGSPMVCESPDTRGQYFMVGIASYALRDCNQRKAYDMFLRIADYLPWIDAFVLEQSREPSFYHPEPKPHARRKP